MYSSQFSSVGIVTGMELAFLLHRAILSCGLSASNIFFHISHKPQHFREKTPNMKCVVWFCLQHLSENGANRVNACSLRTSVLTYKWRTKK